MSYAWSFSRLNKYRQCPLKSYWMDYAPKDQRVKEPPNPIFEKGNDMHKAMELAVKKDRELPVHLMHTRPIVDAIRRAPVQMVEEKMAFTQELKPVTFFDQNCWVRVIHDILVLNADQTHAVCIDWKSGKPRPESDQLELFAGSVFTKYPSVETVDTYYGFLEHKKFARMTYHKKMEDHIWQKFGEEAYQIEHAYKTGDWQPCPGKQCEWCPVPKSKCRYSKVDE